MTALVYVQLFGRRPCEGALQTQTGAWSGAFGRGMQKVPLRRFGRLTNRMGSSPSGGGGGGQLIIHASNDQLRAAVLPRFFFLQHSHVNLFVETKNMQAHHSRWAIASTLTAPSAKLVASWSRCWAEASACRSTHAGTRSSTPKTGWSCDAQGSSRGSDAVRPAPSDAGSVASSTYHRPRGSSCQAAQPQQGGKGLQCHRWYHQRAGS